MFLASVMDEVAGLLDAIAGLRTHAWPATTITPPAAVVSYPDGITTNSAYARGMSTIRLPIIIVVGRVTDRSTRDVLGAYCDGSGASSVVQALYAKPYVAFDALSVDEDIEFDVVNIGGQDYMAAVFTAEISGSAS